MAEKRDGVKIKRAYQPPESSDGYRVLVDRLWPRGVKKEELRLDEWAKDLAPSPDLRKWFGHDPARWEEFRQRYKDELASPERTRILAALADRTYWGPITLVYGARDEEHNGAVVVSEVLKGMMDGNRQQVA